MIFLRNFSLIILCTLFIFSSCDSSKKETFPYSKYVEEDKPVTVLQTLENENLSVKIYSNSFTEIEDLKNEIASEVSLKKIFSAPTSRP